MPMLTTLDLPTQPRWATSGTYVDEPPEGYKNSGFFPNHKAPAKWYNWLQNINYEWTKRIASLALMNWDENVSMSANDIGFAIFHPEIGVWVVTHSNAQTTFNSVDGHSWTPGTILNANGLFNFGAIDSVNYIFGNATGDIEYSANGGQSGALTTVTSATIGGAGALSCITTKYPDSDFAIVIRGTSPAAVRIASTGITGSFAAPSTPPPGMSASAIGNSLIHISGSTWLLLVTRAGFGTSASLYKSLDDGDVWADVPGLVFPAGSTGPGHMAYNPDSGRLVLSGSIDAGGSGEYIGYSDDLGDNWVAATIDTKGIPLIGYSGRVYYCGADTWIVANTAMVPDDAQGMYISVDNGVTWKVADSHVMGIGGGGLLGALACDGRKIMAFGDVGFNAYSFAI